MIGGTVYGLQGDLRLVEEIGSAIGSVLNAVKRKVIPPPADMVLQRLFGKLSGCAVLATVDTILLCAPIGEAANYRLFCSAAGSLAATSDNLRGLRACDAFLLLRRCFGAPKWLHLLRSRRFRGAELVALDEGFVSAV